jgi:hypothetical protein
MVMRLVFMVLLQFCIYSISQMYIQIKFINR